MGWLGRIFGAEKKEEPRFVVPQMPDLPSLPVNTSPIEYPRLEPREVKEVVFVRLDRFETAEKSFQDAKVKLEEIESNIRSVDQINEREDERLLSWNKDLEKIKMLLVKIDEKTFDQI
jgi:CRISPR/Cas system CSM-associated protein Csm4 (group 5 of RAMP superfamily)